jgi:LysM repeat protein
MEKNKINILILFLLLFTFSFDTYAQIKDVPVVKLFEKEYYKYNIKSKETLFSICKRFNVTEAEILSMNPFIINGLEVGQTLMIPVKISKVSTDKEIFIGKDRSSVKVLSDEEKPKKSSEITHNKSRITILLPFTEAEISGFNDRYIEFYEGFLMAVDSLKSLGLSFEVQALESGMDAETINHAIITGKLKETDYCIGGINSEQISVLAEWAKKTQKTLILPFSSRIPELENNPYIFQTNTPRSYMYEHLADYTVKRIEKSNIIFLKSGNTDDSDVQSLLIPKIKSKLNIKGINYTEISDDEQLESLSKVLKEGIENNIIPSSLTINETNQLISRIGAYLSANPQKKITLFGYPDWQTMNKAYKRRLNELNSYIFSSFYVDVQEQNVRNFQISFIHNFGTSMLNTYPKYGMMGYDIAAYFIPRMFFEKSENSENRLSISPLQNDFQFSVNNDAGGSYNKCFYIIHYTRNNTVEIIPLH